MADTLPSTISTLAVALLFALCIGGVIYAVFQPALSGSKRRDARMHVIAARPQSTEKRRQVKDSDRKRRSVQEQLKEFEERQKNKQSRRNNPTLSVRIEQAGLSWERKHFIYFSIASGVVFMVIALIVSPNIWVTLGLTFAGALGFPRWYVNYKRQKRFNKFLDELPSAVDIIVRGVKAGLPLGDCIKIVAREANEPVASEFQKIVETQVMGISLSDAVARLPDRVPLAEANFFAIVVAIQQKAGGGLSEALSNLSRVLRGRKTLKRKIKALSSEAKSSAGIIGSLPIVVSGILGLTAPDYIGLLFTTTTGNIIIGGGLFWMFCGIMVMRQMINFDF
ncbi:type II secretion system F family protein [Roseibium suaedae]|uniref:Tight adherence protein B n=1 Tax=Roseibium suaedae TaxID=735517 RepID=A0A1M7A3C0_9HYPH|nr:type II secretion system F family protein [Roseibium suaedae]SHL37125.1 tight adherence protein B [Roseibium suaedae]